jgi:plastocyanin
MENTKVVNKKKKLVPIIVAIVIVLIIAFIAIMSNKKQAPAPSNNTGEQGATTENQNGETAEAPVAATSTVNPVLEGSRVEAPGADIITKTGQVVNSEGEEVKTDVAYNSPEAPKQTLPVAIAEIPFATKLSLNENGFVPQEFRIAKGKALTIALTGTANNESHVFTFDDPVLGAVYINVRPNETRATTFNAPDKAGEYKFFCDFPGHNETGKMIVE